MNMKELAKQWKEENKNFIELHKTDKQLLNYEWTTYVDGLCKDGQVTQQQWSNLSNLF